jgi:DNA helicase-2/ATP-dependent DNA helicase PcrA
MIEIEDPLNAYSRFPGPILLLAGPGTGKTYQIENRILFLFSEMNADPDEVSVITFTSAAALSMRTRLSNKSKEAGIDKCPSIINTMHSLGNTIIGEYPEYFGLLKDYSVLANQEFKTVLMKDAARLAGIETGICTAVENCRTKGNCKEDGSDPCKVCRAYRTILRSSGYVDYDDLIFLACRLLNEQEDFAVEFRKKTRFLLIDEYQDINEAQCDFIKLLSKNQEDGVFAVGDDDQSIYSFRGGDPKYIKNFESYFHQNPCLGKLSVSWRCPEHIALGARAVVENFYPDRAKKPPLTISEDISTNEKIYVHNLPSEIYESNSVAKICEAAVKKNKSAIILIPNKRYLPYIREVFVKRGLRYIYKTEPSKEGLTRYEYLMQWYSNPNDNAITRYLLDLITNNYDELVGALPLSEQGKKSRRTELTDRWADIWKEINDRESYIDIFVKRAAAGEEYLIENRILSDCIEPIKNLMGSSKVGRRGNLPEFLFRTGQAVAPGVSPKGFLREIEEWRMDKTISGMGGSFLPVEIYNLPSSKGLEADVVCVIGMSEQIFPHDGDDIEEKARLFYVAMTRAKQELHLFSCRKRSGGTTFAKVSYGLRPSRYIDSIPEEHKEIIYRKPIKS